MNNDKLAIEMGNEICWCKMSFEKESKVFQARLYVAVVDGDKAALVNVPTCSKSSVAEIFPVWSRVLSGPMVPVF